MKNVSGFLVICAAGVLLWLGICIWYDWEHPMSTEAILFDDTSNAIKVSEWRDTFETICPCGNYLYAHPCDLDHYKFVCVKCDAVYENDWNG